MNSQDRLRAGGEELLAHIRAVLHDEQGVQIESLLIGKAVQRLGAPLPDMSEIFAHVTKTVGSSEFGVPRVADGRRSRETPLMYLQQLWSRALPIAQKYCDKPVQLPMVFGIGLQRALEQSKGVMDATHGARIAMESAVAMSTVLLPEAPKQQAHRASSPAAQRRDLLAWKSSSDEASPACR